MNSHFVRGAAGLLFALSLGARFAPAAEPRTGSTASKTGAITAGKSAPARSGAARGPLPDPALLDGSAHAVEKKSEHGMIGEFELPGDENASSGKVGGGGRGGAGGAQPTGQQPAQPAISVPLPPIPGLPGVPGAAGGQGGGLPGLPQGGGLGTGTDPSQQGIGLGQSGAGGNPLDAAGGAQSAGQPGGAGGAQGGQGGQQGGQPGGAQGGQAGGMQVGGLQGAAGAGNNGNGGPGNKPSPIAIGDSAMRIEPSGGVQGAAGPNAQVAGHTQQHEKGTGSGGKGSSGVQTGNRVEKGRAIPSGL